jgi:hypothetical protein
MPEMAACKTAKPGFFVAGYNHKCRAAPHCPAGHFSPYSDGEKDAFVGGFANNQRCTKGAAAAIIYLLPVTIR